MPDRLLARRRPARSSLLDRDVGRYARATGEVGRLRCLQGGAAAAPGAAASPEIRYPAGMEDSMRFDRRIGRAVPVVALLVGVGTSARAQMPCQGGPVCGGS